MTSCLIVLATLLSLAAPAVALSETDDSSICDCPAQANAIP